MNDDRMPEPVDVAPSVPEGEETAPPLYEIDVAPAEVPAKGGYELQVLAAGLVREVIELHRVRLAQLEHRSDAARRERRRAFVLASAFGAILGAVGIYLAAVYLFPPEVSVPANLRGTWVATNGPHAGLKLEMTVDEIAFHQIGAGVARFPIVGVASKPVAEGVLYTVTYADRDDKLELSFYYLPDQRLRFRFMPEVVWARPPT